MNKTNSTVITEIVNNQTKSATRLFSEKYRIDKNAITGFIKNTIFSFYDVLVGLLL